ncbi:uncharacterized protein LOC141594659 [Silene latifolia]|uniref:uncharacterized protein LOC141594659 n=1 Tax=Silene latifolia TaxID=37657 RepID=UPI003D789665
MEEARNNVYTTYHGISELLNTMKILKSQTLAAMTNGEGSTKIDASSPYYLGPQDKPGDSITPIRLTLDNFDEWAHDIRVALKSRRKCVFVNGTINEPKAPCTPDDWETIHSMLVSWLRTTISSEAGIRDCRQTENMTVAIYYGKLCQLWDDLDQHEPIIDCKCCTSCTSSKQYAARRDSDRLHHFLLGLLPGPYASLRSVILSQNPLPTVARAFHMISQEERVRGIDKANEIATEIANFHVNSKTKPPVKASSQMNRTERQKLRCTNCNRDGHDRSMCFDLMDERPDWWYELKGLTKPTRGTGYSRGRGGGAGRGGGRGGGYQSRDAGSSTEPNASKGESTHNVQTSSAVKETEAASLVTVYGTPSHTHSGKWLIDTGCSHHVTGNFDLLYNIRNILHALWDYQMCNLISASQLSDDLNCEFVTNSAMCIIQDRATREMIGTGDRLDGLYYLHQAQPTAALSTITVSASFNLWHKRLGHPSEQVVQLLPFFRSNKQSLSKPCEVCHRAKHIRSSFSLSNNKASCAFELIHCDLWGPYDTPSFSGARYFLTLVDDFSRGVWIYLLNNKTDVHAKFMLFVAMLKRQFSADIKTVRSDNGTEFNTLKPYFDSQGILFQSSCVGTPQQNGRVERKHQHILNVARALRFQAGLPIEFWGECALAAAYLINRTPSRILEGVTPYEMIFSQPPNFENIRVFGSLCYAHNQRARGDKFASRGRKYNFPYLEPLPSTSTPTETSDDIVIDWENSEEGVRDPPPSSSSAQATDQAHNQVSDQAVDQASDQASDPTPAVALEVPPADLGRGHRPK